jgi:hypothetical protein
LRFSPLFQIQTGRRRMQIPAALGVRAQLGYKAGILKTDRP